MPFTDPMADGPAIQLAAQRALKGGQTLARTLDLPIVLVVDCSGQVQSIAALVSGISQYRRDIFIAGIILNRVAGPEHEAMLRKALDPSGIPVVGALPYDERLSLPERHLGLVQAGEHPDLEHFLEQAADIMEERLSISTLRHIWSRPRRYDAMANVPRLKPIGTNIAIARDDAFAFAYPHIYEGWRRRGVQLSFFSPLANEAPPEDANAIYLPGGYPELHAARLAEAIRFRTGMLEAAARGTNIYGECGGYMVLGETLETEDGEKHNMLGLLPLETSMKQKKLRIGYRLLEPIGINSWQTPLKAHEFHCAHIVREGKAERLFRARDAAGRDLGEVGLRVANVAGSFMHIIDLSGDHA